MAWKRVKKLTQPQKGSEFLSTHTGASCLVFDSEGKTYLVVSGRDKENYSNLVLAPFNLNNMEIEGSFEFLMGPGHLGSFSDCGVSYPSIASDGEKSFLFYAGWTQMVRVAFQNLHEINANLLF